MLKKIVIIAVAVLLLPLVFSVSEDPDAWEGNVLDVFIIDGQSNAAYSTSFADLSVVAEDYPNAPSKKLLYYGTDEAPIRYGLPGSPTYDTTFASYGIHEMYDDGWKIGEYEPGLAYHISQRSNHDVLIINIAVPGASVEQLLPTGECGVYGFKVIELALDEVRDQYDTLNMLGYLWCQGEANSKTPIPQYEADFMKINTEMKKVGSDMCYIVEVRAIYGNSVVAQRDLMHEYSNIVFGTDISNTFTIANGLMEPDGAHYTQKGRDLISDIVGEKIDLNEPKHTEVYAMLGAVGVVLIVGIVLAATGLIYIRRNVD